MRKGGFDLLLVLTLILALGTIIQDYRFETQIARERTTALALERHFGSLDVALADLRAAEMGYLAAGQGADFWMTRASDLATQIESSLTTMRSTTSSAPARGRYEAAATALAELTNVDGRARDHLKNEQHALAADLVFLDGLTASQRVSTELAAARTEESRAAEARITRQARLRFGMSAVVLAFVFIVAVRAARRVTEPAGEPASTAQMLRDLPPAVKPVSVAPGTATRVTAPVATNVNLSGAAELCVDLGRLMDSRDVPALVERTAAVLEAKGVIVWIADFDGAHLRPSFSHGYAEKVLSRLGRLQVDSDNVTSLAFRSMRPQVVNGTTLAAAGAITVPLVTAAGCVGVLAAETRAIKPSAETVALARIIAAQIAALVGPEQNATERVVEA